MLKIMHWDGNRYSEEHREFSNVELAWRVYKGLEATEERPEIALFVETKTPDKKTGWLSVLRTQIAYKDQFDEKIWRER